MEFTGVKTVKVYEVGTVAMNNYQRSGTNRYGTPAELEDTIHEYMMTQDRAFTFTIDKGNNMEQNMIKKAGQAMNRQVREVVTPEIDKYRFGKWAANAGTTETVDAPTGENVYDTLVDAKATLDNLLVPQKNRTLYVGSAFYKALLKCEEYIRLEKTGNKTVTTGKVGEVLGMDVKFVPDSYFPSGVGFMIIMKDAAMSPVKLHELNLHQDPPGISGHLAEGRFIYDAFVNETKKKGIYVGKTA
jgi:N4-gp56 family major capsid protein